MKKFVLGALYALCIVSFPAGAQGTLNSYQTVDIKAPIWTVWDAVKDFDGLHTWHPMFSDDELKSGALYRATKSEMVSGGPSPDPWDPDPGHVGEPDRDDTTVDTTHTNKSPEY